MTTHACPCYEPKRRSDREEQLANELAFEKKVTSGLEAAMRSQDRIIANLQGELAELRANAAVLLGVMK